MNPQLLQELLTVKMPYGKYEGRVIASLPESYLIWYQTKGFPAGKLGMLLATMYEIKLNGLEYLLIPLR
ncbi:putative quorum-sensing-regulated virulence factor [compost metagenome]